MIIMILFMSAFFLLLGFAITEKNAKYLLSGYNTMSNQERANFDLTGFLKFFKTFHILLALIYLIVCLALYFFADQDIFSMSLSLIPVLAYGYLIWQSKGYYKNKKLPLATKVGVVFIIIIGLGLVVVFQFL